MEYTAIRRCLSPARLSRFDGEAGAFGQGPLGAIELYEWNARLSAAMLVPLHLFEVVIRNAVDESISSRYGASWPWNRAFIHSLPAADRGIDARGELLRQASIQPSTGKVIAELRFAFWEQMFTRRFVPAIWEQGFPLAFPLATPAQPVRQRVIRMREDIESIRRVRNRIAHYEPIFDRPILQLVETIEAIAAWRSADLGDWVRCSHSVREVVAARPPWFRRGAAAREQEKKPERSRAPSSPSR